MHDQTGHTIKNQEFSTQGRDYRDAPLIEKEFMDTFWEPRNTGMEGNIEARRKNGLGSVRLCNKRGTWGEIKTEVKQKGGRRNGAPYNRCAGTKL